MKYIILVSLFALGGCVSANKSCAIKKSATAQCKAEACKIAKKCKDACAIKKKKSEV